MKIISHRANLNGIVKELENNPKQILEVIKLFDVEIDVWYINGELFLGHDFAQYKIPFEFFNDKMWLHCKNMAAVEILAKTNLNWFWHENDKMTQTSKGFIWCYPGIYVQNGITVEFGHKENLPDYISGVCTDFPIKYEK